MRIENGGSPEEREQAQPHYIHWRHNGDKGHSLLMLLRMSCCTVAESAAAAAAVSDVADAAS